MLRDISLIGLILFVAFASHKYGENSSKYSIEQEAKIVAFKEYAGDIKADLSEAKKREAITQLENKKLREALDKIANRTQPVMYGYDTSYQASDKERIAKEALAKSQNNDLALKGFCGATVKLAGGNMDLFDRNFAMATVANAM